MYSLWPNGIWQTQFVWISRGICGQWMQLESTSIVDLVVKSIVFALHRSDLNNWTQLIIIYKFEHQFSLELKYTYAFSNDRSHNWMKPINCQAHKLFNIYGAVFRQRIFSTPFPSLNDVFMIGSCHVCGRFYICRNHTSNQPPTSRVSQSAQDLCLSTVVCALLCLPMPATADKRTFQWEMLKGILRTVFVCWCSSRNSKSGRLLICRSHSAAVKNANVKSR